MTPRPQTRMTHVLVAAARSSTSRVRRGFIRPDEIYPNLYYRYSHDIANVFGLRILGLYAVDGKVKVRYWLVVANIVIIFVPVLAGAVASRQSGATPDQAFTSIFWIFYFSCLAVVVQACSLGGVHVFHGLTPSLERCLTKKGMDRYERWAAVSTAFLPQLIWAIVWSALGCLALYFLSVDAAVAETLYITWASYLSVAISVIYLSGGIWWVFAGAILSTRIVADGCLRLFPYAPAMTPAIELLVRCYRLAFMGACAGVLLCLTPILTWTRVLPASNVSITIVLSLVALSFLSLLVIAVIPEWMLSKAILRERHVLLSELNDHLVQRPRNVGTLREVGEYKLMWMQTLVTAPRGTISGSVIVTIIAALLSSTVPLFISEIITP